LEEEKHEIGHRFCGCCRSADHRTVVVRCTASSAPATAPTHGCADAAAAADGRADAAAAGALRGSALRPGFPLGALAPRS
jgi:hypothetical protein